MKSTTTAKVFAITVATTLALGIAPTIAFGADYTEPGTMTFSGSNVATAIDLQAGTITDEVILIGKGRLGEFTYRELHADSTAPETSILAPVLIFKP